MSRTIRKRQYPYYFANVETYTKDAKRFYFDQIINHSQEKKEYARSIYDGQTSDSNSKRLYRTMTNKIIRNRNRIITHKLMKNHDHAENMTFPDIKDGKTYAWSIW
jgi:nitrogenase subunit NifH